MSTDEYFIQTKNIHKFFGRIHALRGVDFNVGYNEIVGLVGDNGAGKSTLIKILSGVHPWDKGELFIKGQRIDKRRYSVQKAREFGIEVVYQERALAVKQTLWRNIFMGREITNDLGLLNVSLMKKKTEDLMKRYLGFKSSITPDSVVDKLSGGERQGVAIARALFFKANLLILDEPTLGLDPQTTRALHEFIFELSKEGITVVVTTHDMTEADVLCHRIAIMDKARIVALDTTRNLRRLLSDGDSTVIDIEVPNLSQSILSRLKEVDAVTSVVPVESYRLRIHARGDNTIGTIVTAIISEGGEIRKISSVEPNLEDVFLYLTGREMRDEATEKVPSSRGHGWRRRSLRIR